LIFCLPSGEQRQRILENVFYCV